jgi:hypothetical protein
MSDNKQKALIHICKQQLLQAGALSEQGYRDTLMRNFDVASSTELTYEQATRFIDDLVAMGAVITKRGKGPGSRVKATTPCTPFSKGESQHDLGNSPLEKGDKGGCGCEIIKLPSRDQLDYIERLRADVRWRIQPDGYQRWLKAFLHKDHITTGKDASKIIEALKAMIKRQQYEGVENFHDHASAF